MEAKKYIECGDAEKFLRELADKKLILTGAEYANGICYAACHIKDAPEAKIQPMEWVNANDRLPILFETVIISILTRNGFDEPTTIETIGYYEKGEWHCYTGRICEGEVVTHWMEMPKPPEGWTNAAR